MRDACAENGTWLVQYEKYTIISKKTVKHCEVQSTALSFVGFNVIILGILWLFFHSEIYPKIYFAAPVLGVPCYYIPIIRLISELCVVK